MGTSTGKRWGGQFVEQLVYAKLTSADSGARGRGTRRVEARCATACICCGLSSQDLEQQNLQRGALIAESPSGSHGNCNAADGGSFSQQLLAVGVKDRAAFRGPKLAWTPGFSSGFSHGNSTDIVFATYASSSDPTASASCSARCRLQQRQEVQPSNAVGYVYSGRDLLRIA